MERLDQGNLHPFIENSIFLYQQKSNPFDQTVPLSFFLTLHLSPLRESSQHKTLMIYLYILKPQKVE
jgi:hypothetical protein